MASAHAASTPKKEKGEERGSAVLCLFAGMLWFKGFCGSGKKRKGNKRDQSLIVKDVQLDYILPGKLAENSCKGSKVSW